MERVKALLQGDQPVKWLFYGDSITHGAFHTFGWRDYVELFSERVRFEMGRTQDIVINTAISGNRTSTLLETFDWRVTQFAPHVVFLMIGMNDCSEASDVSLEQFEKNLHELDERIQAFGGRTVMQTTCPILPDTAPERIPHFDGFMDAIRRVAADRGLPLVDHTKHWRENEDKHYYWMSNAFHPNGWGHLAFAHLLFRELGIWDPHSTTCKLFVP